MTDYQAVEGDDPYENEALGGYILDIIELADFYADLYEKLEPHTVAQSTTFLKIQEHALIHKGPLMDTLESVQEFWRFALTEDEESLGLRLSDPTELAEFFSDEQLSEFQSMNNTLESLSSGIQDIINQAEYIEEALSGENDEPVGVRREIAHLRSFIQKTARDLQAAQTQAHELERATADEDIGEAYHPEAWNHQPPADEGGWSP